MKKIITLFLLAMTISVVNAQTAKDFFFANSEVTWLGVDFSNVQLVGDFTQAFGYGDQSTDEVKDKYFPAWNNLFFSEQDKYDISKMIRNEKLDYDIEMVMELNSNADSKELRTYKPKMYSQNDIQAIVKKYKLKGKKGLGLVFIAEALNKNEKTGYFHFVVIDMGSSKVLFQEKLEGAPGGFGLRNYWAASMYDVIKNVTKKHFKKWSKSY